MTNSKLSCAVIGGGATGAAAAYALAKRGASVSLFEQFKLGHQRGSSHGPTRLFRTAYFEHPDYVPILKRAAALWRGLEGASGATLLNMCGVFLAGDPDADVIQGTLSAAEQHNLPIERLTAARAREQFPCLALDDEMEMFIEPLAGFIHADRACATFIQQAYEMGACIRDETPVLSWRKTGGQIELKTRHETVLVDRLVIATGSYAPDLLGSVGALVKPVGKHLFWSETNDERLTLKGGFLPFGVAEKDGRFFYGFPAIDADGVKTGEHTGGVGLNAPDELSQQPETEASDDIKTFLDRRAPLLAPFVRRRQTCLYEMSPDGHFIIDTYPDCPEVSYAIGLSGHGFKFAPAIGEALADLAFTGETVQEFDFLKASRFDQA